MLEDFEQGCPQERKRSGDVRVTTAGFIFLEDGVFLPVVADFNTRPVAPARMRRATTPQHSESERSAKADLLIRAQRFEEALTLCDQSLRDTAWAYGAGKQLCGLYFRQADYDRAIDLLATLYPEANEEQQRELLLIWSNQVTKLIHKRFTPPLPLYLELFHEHFPRSMRCMSLAIEVLFGLGQEHRAPELCPNLRQRCYYSLRRSGLYRRAIAEYGKDIPPHLTAETLLSAGQYREVLEIAAAYPNYMSDALTYLGRAEEAIQRYPDHCQNAYLELGKYQQLLDHFPQPSEYQIKALFALKKVKALQNYPQCHSYLWHIAQLHASPENLLRMPHSIDPQNYHHALLWRALQHLTANQPDPAGELLKRIPLVQSPHFWWPDHTSEDVTLATITRGLMGNRALMQSELELIRNKHQHTAWQQNWHDASFLLGAITEDHYRQQPRVANLEQRLPLVKAFDQDLKGCRSKTLKGYQLFLNSYKHYLLVRQELRQFIDWRLTCLSAVN